MENGFVRPKTVSQSEPKKFSIASLGLLTGGCIVGALGTHSYHLSKSKKSKKSRNIELALLWMLKNVEIKGRDESVGIRLGPVIFSFEQAKVKSTSSDNVGNIDDEDIDI